MQDFSLILTLKQDNIQIVITPSSVELNKLVDEAIVRPRHIKLSNLIFELIRQEGK